MSKRTLTLADFGLSSHRATSYTLGPIDADTLASLTVDPISAPTFQLLVPGPNDLPTSVLVDAEFREGAIAGYYYAGLEDDIEAAAVTPLVVANWVFRTLSWELAHEGDYAWIVGNVLGALSSLAETDRFLALVGIAHLSFLLLLIPALPYPDICQAVHQAGACHDVALGAYRDQVRSLKEQGVPTLHAQRQTLDARRSMAAGEEVA